MGATFHEWSRKAFRLESRLAGCSCEAWSKLPAIQGQPLIFPGPFEEASHVDSASCKVNSRGMATQPCKPGLQLFLNPRVEKLRSEATRFLWSQTRSFFFLPGSLSLSALSAAFCQAQLVDAGAPGPQPHDHAARCGRKPGAACSSEGVSFRDLWRSSPYSSRILPGKFSFTPWVKFKWCSWWVRVMLRSTRSPGLGSAKLGKRQPAQVGALGVGSQRGVM